MKRSMRKQLCLLLCIVLTVPLLSGCGKIKNLVSSSSGIKPDTPINSDFKWINSEIDGAITENTEIRLQDDFFTAVNKDWILAQDMGDEMSKSVLMSSETPTNERKMALIQGQTDETETAEGTKPAGLTDEMIRHNLDLVHKYAQLAGNWDARNKLGVKPAEKYIQAIEDIQTMDDLNQYIINQDGLNISQAEQIPVEVTTPVGEPKTKYSVVLDGYFNLMMGTCDQYADMSETQLVNNFLDRNSVSNILGGLGYSKAEIRSLLRKCYRYEIRAAKIQEDTNLPVYGSTAYVDSVDDKEYTLKDMEEISGDYPLMEILKAGGLDQSNSYRIYFPDYTKKICGLYQEKYLNEIKAYLIVHTVCWMDSLLDKTSFDKFVERHDNQENIEYLLKDMSEEEILRDYYFGECFPEPLEEAYAAAYCTEEQKAELTEICNEIMEVYPDIINGEDWLSEETKKKTIDKLKNIAIYILYPDTFTDYTGLNLSACENLLDAQAAIQEYNKKLNYSKVTKQYDKSEWTMTGEFRTTIVNACYQPYENSITIFAGVISSGEIFSVDHSKEENLAQIGAAIGHEISHAFDDTGRNFDKYGLVKEWWSQKDIDTFEKRVDRLQKYYSIIDLYNGGSAVDGSKVSGEAIADMAGLKSVELVGEKTKNFDFDKFFRAYAHLWAEKTSFDYFQKGMQSADEHPASFLRTNVTLMQSERFLEIYGIQKGDGMYPGKKGLISVW